MKARLINMSLQMRRDLKLYLWQVFDVEKIQIETTRHKYSRETKWIYCINMKTGEQIRFLWYEVEIF